VTEQDNGHSWKRTFDPDFDPDNPPEEPRVDLSEKQKAWFYRVFAHFAHAVLGMPKGTIPDAIPRYTEERGWFHVPAVKPDLNHIRPVGWQTRVTKTPYNTEDNVVPVSRYEHTGLGATEDDFVVHPDAQEAAQNYGLFKQGKIPNPFVTLHDDRRAKTKRGEKYWDDSYDAAMQDFNDRARQQYHQDFPDDPFPEHPADKKKKKKRWNGKEWV